MNQIYCFVLKRNIKNNSEIACSERRDILKEQTRTKPLICSLNKQITLILSLNNRYSEGYRSQNSRIFIETQGDPTNLLRE